jgi:hypothetical protein
MVKALGKRNLFFCTFASGINNYSKRELINGTIQQEPNESNCREPGSQSVSAATQTTPVRIFTPSTKRMTMFKKTDPNP